MEDHEIEAIEAALKAKGYHIAWDQDHRMNDVWLLVHTATGRTDAEDYWMDEDEMYDYIVEWLGLDI